MSAVAPVCGTCGEAGIDGSRYCEACGAPVPTGAGPAAQVAPSAISQRAACVGCGAPGDQVDADRYCMLCGLRQPAERDHQEREGAMVVAVTDRGRVHHRNEDAFAIWSTGPSGVPGEAPAEPAPDVVVVMVCDGVSSTADSDRAAVLAAEAGCAAAAEAVCDGEEVGDAARRAMDAAQLAAAGVPASTGDRASCTAVLFVASRRGRDRWDGVVAWAGDSRAYLESNGAMTLITEDHSWGAEQTRAGAPPESVASDPRVHSITRWLGADAPVTELAVKPVSVTNGSRVFVVSDGLWKYVPDLDQIGAAVATHAPTSTLAEVRSLVEFANRRGGSDNITVALATF